MEKNFYGLIRETYDSMRKRGCGKAVSGIQAFRYVVAYKEGIIKILNNETEFEYYKFYKMNLRELRKEAIKGGLEFIFSYPIIFSTIPIVLFAPMSYKFVSVPLGLLGTSLNLKGECKLSAFYHRADELNLDLDQFL